MRFASLISRFGSASYSIFLVHFPVSLIVNGYCKEVLNQLPMEFAVEAQKLLAVSLEGSVG